MATGTAARARGIAAMIVCHCKAVSDRAIRKAVRSGARTRGEVSEACSASMGCGGCAPIVDEIIATETSRESGPGFAGFPEIAVIA